MAADHEDGVVYGGKGCFTVQPVLERIIIEEVTRLEAIRGTLPALRADCLLRAGISRDVGKGIVDGLDLCAPAINSSPSS
jgi:hypothetical protein